MTEWKVTLKLNSNVLKQTAGKALTAYAKELDPILDRQFSDEKWDWWINPRTGQYNETQRRNGQRVTSPRDIIDTGTLLQSKMFRASPNKRRWIWDTPYAYLVKNGYETSRGSIVPGRDWIKAALKELPFSDFIQNYFRR